MRHELFDADLITIDEFNELVLEGSASARRLEAYDGMRARIKELEQKLATASPIEACSC
jgi:hypothetical protein